MKKINDNKIELMVDNVDIDNSDELTPISIEINKELLNYILEFRKMYFTYLAPKNNFDENFVLKLNYKFIEHLFINKINENIDEIESCIERDFDFFAHIGTQGFFISAKSPFGTINFSTEPFVMNNENEKIEQLICDTARSYDLEIDIWNTQENNLISDEKACQIWLNGVDFCEQINYENAKDLLAELINTKIPSDMELIKAISEQSDYAKTLNLDEITTELNYIKSKFTDFKYGIAKLYLDTRNGENKVA